MMNAEEIQKEIDELKKQLDSLVAEANRQIGVIQGKIELRQADLAKLKSKK
jgi:ribosomal protein L29